MPRPCTICSNPQHQAINQALVSGTPYRAVAKRFHKLVRALFFAQRQRMTGAPSLRGLALLMRCPLAAMDNGGQIHLLRCIIVYATHSGAGLPVE